MPLDEKSREEKEAYASKIMAEMKLKNEKLRERYKEVQRDRERAEERNSSITSGKNLRRDADRDFTPKAKPEREWDRGKPNLDSEDWEPKHHEHFGRNSRDKFYSERKNRKEDNWRSRPTSNSSRPTSNFFTKFSNKNETSQESSTPRNEGTHSSNRSRSHHHSSYGMKNPTDSHPQSYQTSKLDNPSPKFSSSQNCNEPKKEPAPRPVEEGMDELMWQCGSMNEAQHKMNRIENWVKSINMNQGFTESNDAVNAKEECKSQNRARDFGSHREKPKKYGVVEDATPRRAKELNSSFRGRDKGGQTFNEPFNSRKKRRERGPSVSDSKNFRDVKRKPASDRPRRKCESDISDHASSMKESDDVDCIKGKIIPHGSKSSDNSRQQDKRKVESTLEDPWGSGMYSNENDCSQGYDAWDDWGTDQQSKNLKENSQSANNSNKYESQRLSDSKSKKYTSQNEDKSNWPKNTYHGNDKYSRKNEDLSKRHHQKKNENENQVPKASSQVCNQVDEVCDEKRDLVVKGINFRQPECSSNARPQVQGELDMSFGSDVLDSSNPNQTECCEMLVDKTLGDNLGRSVEESSTFKQNECNEAKLDDIKGSDKVSRHVVEQNCNLVVTTKVNESFVNKVSNEIVKPVFENDSIEEVESSSVSNQERDLDVSMTSNDQAEEIKDTSCPEEYKKVFKPEVREWDVIVEKYEIEASKSTLSDPEFSKTDNCNESSDANSQLVNYEGSSEAPSKSTDKDSSAEETVDNIEALNLNKKANENVILVRNDKNCEHVHDENITESGTSDKSDPNEEVESELSASTHNIQSGEVNENAVTVSGKKLIDDSKSEPDESILNSSDDGWTTITDDDDEKNVPPLHC